MFLMILGVSAFQLRRKIRKKSVPGRSKIKPQIGWHLDPIFGGSWDQHGWILEGFGRPSWSHVGTQWHQSWTQESMKKSSLFGRPPEPILMNFWWILAPTWGGQGGPTNQLFGDYVGSWSQDAPRPLQEPHKRPQEPPRA